MLYGSKFLEESDEDREGQRLAKVEVGWDGKRGEERGEDSLGLRLGCSVQR